MATRLIKACMQQEAHVARILLVDDDKNFAAATLEMLALKGHDAIGAGSVKEARHELTDAHFDLVLLDLMLPDGSGLELLSDDSLERSEMICVMTGHAGVKSAIQSIGGPSVAYLPKPIELSHIEALLDQLKHTDDSVDSHFGVLVGESDAMQAVYRQIERVAKQDITVLIQGESGSGKELVAQAIHNASGLSGEFVPVNCGSLNKELIASELFGHEKGAFTGADRRHVGFFERSQDGTLFLDEITEMPIDLQPNLLRVLETRKIVRVGGKQEIGVNSRLIAATNRDPNDAMDKHQLREDLYFRLAVFPIRVPPLRERMEDVLPLAEYFLAALNKSAGSAHRFADSVPDDLTNYGWPGNVRELRHVIQRAFVMTDPETGIVEISEHFNSPFARRDAESADDKGNVQVGQSISDMEKLLILRTLEHCKGNKRKTADILGVSLKTLYNRLNEYEDALEDEPEDAS